MPERIDKTALATRDIQKLTAYCPAGAGISVARRFIDHAEFAFKHLAQMPKMGAHLGFQHSSHDDIRRWQIQGFPRLHILYRATPAGIELLRVLDAGRDRNAFFDNTGFPSTCFDLTIWSFACLLPGSPAFNIVSERRRHRRSASPSQRDPRHLADGGLPDRRTCIGKGSRSATGYSASSQFADPQNAGHCRQAAVANTRLHPVAIAELCNATMLLRLQASSRCTASVGWNGSSLGSTPGDNGPEPPWSCPQCQEKCNWRDTARYYAFCGVQNHDSLVIRRMPSILSTKSSQTRS
jgi:plasmid stabilization system protein ParE